MALRCVRRVSPVLRQEKTAAVSVYTRLCRPTSSPSAHGKAIAQPQVTHPQVSFLANSLSSFQTPPFLVSLPVVCFFLLAAAVVAVFRRAPTTLSKMNAWEQEVGADLLNMTASTRRTGLKKDESQTRRRGREFVHSEPAIIRVSPDQKQKNARLKKNIVSSENLQLQITAMRAEAISGELRAWESFDERAKAAKHKRGDTFLIGKLRHSRVASEDVAAHEALSFRNALQAELDEGNMKRSRVAEAAERPKA